MCIAFFRKESEVICTRAVEWLSPRTSRTDFIISRHNIVVRVSERERERGRERAREREGKRERERERENVGGRERVREWEREPGKERAETCVFIYIDMIERKIYIFYTDLAVDFYKNSSFFSFREGPVGFSFLRWRADVHPARWSMKICWAFFWISFFSSLRFVFWQSGSRVYRFL